MRPQRLRQSGRQTFLAEVLVRPLPAGAPSPGHLLDLSRGGACLFAPRALAPGQLVELGRPDGRPLIRGRCVSARIDPDGNRLGISFQGPLTAQGLDALKAAIRPGSRPRAGRDPAR